MQHIRSALAGAMLVLSGAALASAQQATPTPTPQSQQQSQRTHRPHRGRGARGAHALLKGITLSDAEKANLKNVHAKYESQFKTLREQSKPTFEAARAARQRGDTAAARQIMSKAAPQRAQMKQLMQSERNDVRGALTPDHQAVFDTNIKKFESRATKRGARAWNKSGRAGYQKPTSGSTRG